MNGRLLEAAMTGNVQLLHVLLREDVLILDRAMHECNARILDQAMDECNARILDRAMQICIAGILDQARDECIARILDRAMHKCIAKDNPVHLAALFGHANFITEILSLKPEFAWALNLQGQSPLHLASEVGHVEVVKVLLERNPDLCLVCDRGGRIPLHLAAIRGQVMVLEELVKAMPMTAWLLTDERETILHLCTNHKQFKALEKLVELVLDPEFLKLKDRDQNTILHLLSAKTNTAKVIESLLHNHADIVDVINAKNTDGSTPLDVSLENVNGFENLRTNRILVSAGAKATLGKRCELPHKKIKKKPNENDSSWSSEALLVVAILMTTVAFQAAVNPPGGAWKETGCHVDTSNCTSNCNSTQLYAGGPSNSTQHYAGESIMSYSKPRFYLAFTILNLITLFTSMVVVVAELSTILFSEQGCILYFRPFLARVTFIPVFTLPLSYAFLLFMLVRKGLSTEIHEVGMAYVTLIFIALVGLIMVISSNAKKRFFLWYTAFCDFFFAINSAG